MTVAGLHFITTDFPGVRRWLENGAAEGLWGLSVIEQGKPLDVPPAEQYGVGAWCMPYTAIYQEVRAMGVPFGVAWSSSPQESDAGRTQQELLYLIGLTNHTSEVQPDWFACLHPALARVLPRAIHLPAPLHLEPKVEVTKEDWIGFFVPPTEKKAIFSQLLAMRDFQRSEAGNRAVLHTNLEAYKPIMDWLGIEYVLHPWLPRQEYLALLAKCRMVLHASLAESFGYGAADAMMMGTPVVGSPAMSWLPASYRASNANSPESVTKVLGDMYELPPQAFVDPRRAIEYVARGNNHAARAAVDAILQGKV